MGRVSSGAQTPEITVELSFAGIDACPVALAALIRLCRDIKYLYVACWCTLLRWLHGTCELFAVLCVVFPGPFLDSAPQLSSSWRDCREGENRRAVTYWTHQRHGGVRLLFRDLVVVSAINHMLPVRACLGMVMLAFVRWRNGKVGAFTCYQHVLAGSSPVVTPRPSAAGRLAVPLVTCCVVCHCSRATGSTPSSTSCAPPCPAACTGRPPRGRPTPPTAARWRCVRVRPRLVCWSYGVAPLQYVRTA
jgi:hypothetical protein